jgi:hypothetical protein
MDDRNKPQHQVCLVHVFMPFVEEAERSDCFFYFFGSYSQGTNKEIKLILFKRRELRRREERKEITQLHV